MLGTQLAGGDFAWLEGTFDAYADLDTISVDKPNASLALPPTKMVQGMMNPPSAAAGDEWEHLLHLPITDLMVPKGGECPMITTPPHEVVTPPSDRVPMPTHMPMVSALPIVICQPMQTTFQPLQIVAARVGQKSKTPHQTLEAAATAARRIMMWTPPPEDACDGRQPEKKRKTGWKTSEDVTIQQCVRRYGTQWPMIAAHLPDRTADAVRNRWHRLQKDLPPSDSSDENGAASAEGGAPPPAKGPAPSSLAPSGGPVADGPPAAKSEFSLTFPATPPSSLVSFAAAESVAAESVATLLPTPLVASGSACGAPPGGVIRGAAHGRTTWSADEDAVIEAGVAKFGSKWRQIASFLPGRSDSSVRNRWMRLRGWATGSSGELELPASPPPSEGDTASPSEGG